MLAPLPPNSESAQLPRDLKPLREQRPRVPGLQSVQIYPRDTRPAIANGSILVDSWATIRRHWRIILKITIAGLLAALVLTLFQTPRYRAFALLEVRSINGEFMDLKTVDPTSSGTPDAAEADVQTQIKIIESQPVTIRTMERMELYVKNRTSTAQNYWSELLSTIGLMKPTSQPSADLLRTVAGSTRVRPVGPTRIIQITADSTDPFLAQLYVNTLADEYRAQTVAAREINSSATADWLTSQLKDLQSHLQQAQSTLENFARDNSLMFLEESSENTGPSVSQQRLQELQADLARAQADRMTKQAAVEQTNSQNPDSLPPVLDNGPIRDYELKLADLRRQLAEVSSTMKPTHPTALRIQNQINEVTATIQREKNNVLGRMRSEYEAAQRRESLLATAYRVQAATVAEQQTKLVRYNELRSEVQSSQQLYDAMQRKVTEAHIAAALHTSPIRIVNPAMRPNQVVSPNWLLNSLGGFAASLILGLVAAFVIEGSDNRIRTPGEASSHLEFRELGAIPNASGGLVLRSDQPLPVLTESRGQNGRVKPTLVGDSFRSVLQSLLFVGDQGTPIGVIAVTSPEPRDGKSSVVSNLAQALSELNKNVLLIDCDLRRPSLHKSFELPNDAGVADLLSGTGQLDSATIQRHIVSTRVAGVSIITAGAIPDSIPLILTGDRMRRLLKYARDCFDMVVVDCPPLLQGPDARIMGRNSDGLIMVLRAGKTTFSSAQSASLVLRQDNIPLLGVILNDWNPKESSYYSSYRSYYEAD